MNDILYISIYIDNREYSLLSLMNASHIACPYAKEIEQRLWFQNNSLQIIQFVKEKLTESELARIIANKIMLS